MWEVKPQALDDADWSDLHAGALFFGARDAAIALLDQIEVAMARRAEATLSLDALPRRI